MTKRERSLNTKDLELLKNLPNLAEKINQNMKTVDNLINTQRELNSSLSSVNSSNNGLRGLGHSKGKNQKLNLEEAIDIKNIVKQSIQGLNNIFVNEKKSENKKHLSNNPLASSSNSSLAVLKLKENVNLNNYGYLSNFENNNINNCHNKGNVTGVFVGKNNYNKGKNINLGNNTEFEPIEEENNLGINDFATNNYPDNSNSKPSIISANTVNQNANGKNKKKRFAKDKKDALSTLNNINILTSRLTNNITNIQNNVNINNNNNNLIANEKTAKSILDDKNLNNNLNKLKSFSKQATTGSSSNAYNNNNINFDLNKLNNNNNNNSNNNQNQIQMRNTLASTGGKNQATNLKKKQNNNSNIINITNNSNATTDAGLTLSNFPNVLNSSKANNKNLKLAKEKSFKSSKNATTDNIKKENSNSNNTNNNSNISTNNNNNLNNNNLNESISAYFLAERISDQMDIINVDATSTKISPKSNNNLNGNKNLKIKSFNSNNNNNIIVSSSLNINKEKSKSRVKSTNKRYSHLTDSENKFEDFIINDFNDAKSVNIKTDGNKDICKINSINNKNNIEVNRSKNVNVNTATLNKKLPRDSKSPNIRNYRTKRNMNSISLNYNNTENTQSDLKKIQISNNFEKPENYKENTTIAIYSTENIEKKNNKPKPFLKEVAKSEKNSNAIVSNLSKTPSNNVNKSKTPFTTKSFNNNNSIYSKNTNKNTINSNDFNEINCQTNQQMDFCNDKFLTSVQNSAKKHAEINYINDLKDEKNLQKLKSNKKLNSNNLLKSQRNIDFEKEKNTLDSFDNEFLNSHNENLKKLDLNSIQITSINLFRDVNNNNNHNKNNQSESLDLNITNPKYFIENLKIKSEEFFKMMYLFAEISKSNSNDFEQKNELDIISKNVSELIFYQTKNNFKRNNNFNYNLNSSLDDFFINNNCDFKSNTLAPNGKSNYFSLVTGNTNEKTFEFNRSAHAVNSLAQARKKKEILRSSKNINVNLNTYLNSLNNNLNSDTSNNTNENILTKLNNKNDIKDLYPKYNFDNNLNELNHLRNSYNNKIFTKEAEININAFINSNKTLSCNVNSINSNNLNSTLIEDLPLENPFVKAKYSKEIFAKNKNGFLSGEVKSNINNKNNFIDKNNLNKIIKIQKFWRLWKIEKLIYINEFSKAACEIKNNLFNKLNKNQKLNSLINNINQALSIFDSIRGENSKESDVINDYMNFDNQIVDNHKMDKYHKEIINNYLKKQNN